MGKVRQSSWFWIDPACFSHENTLMFHALKLLNPSFKRYKDFEQFSDDMVDFHLQHKAVYVVASASLDKADYKALQNCELIDSIVLYCRNAHRGMKLSQKYDRIKNVFV